MQTENTISQDFQPPVVHSLTSDELVNSTKQINPLIAVIVQTVAKQSRPAEHLDDLLVHSNKRSKVLLQE